MGTEQKIGVLSGQVAYLAFRTCRAELVIDELRKLVPENTYDTILGEAERKFAAHHIDSITRMKNILSEINPSASDEQIKELLALLSVPRN